jgi:hypothetical protein
MMKQDTIDLLLDLSLQAFALQASPDTFAQAAAHQAAFAAASVYCADAADGAALLAGGAFLQELSTATHYSANITDASLQTATAKRHYRSTRLAFFDKKELLPPKPISEPGFLKLVESIKISTTTVEREMSSLYQQAFIYDEEGNEKARRAAFYAYADTYTTTRSAYVRAIFLANKCKNATAQQALFRQLMAGRLQQALSYDTVSPHFLVRVLHHRASKIIAVLLLIAAIAAILVATYGVLSAPFIPWLASGVAAAGLSLGLLITSFCMDRKMKQIHLANQDHEARIVSCPNV